MAVLFFLVSHPSDEETPCDQPPPCGQTEPWSNPYSSQCGQPAPLMFTCYVTVFFFLVCHPGDEETPCGQPASLWPNSTPVSSLLILVWPASTVGVNWLHGGVLLSCESPLWWGNSMQPASTLWPASTLISSLLVPMWPTSTISVNCLHGGVLLPCESP